MKPLTDKQRRTLAGLRLHCPHMYKGTVSPFAADLKNMASNVDSYVPLFALHIMEENKAHITWTR